MWFAIGELTQYYKEMVRHWAVLCLACASAFAADLRSTKGSSAWPFTPLVAPSIPKVNSTAWGRNAIDAFILAKLESKGIEPAPLVSRRVLLRRLFFDLVGMPPTPAEMDQFLQDSRSDDAAYDDFVDKLLGDPRYGERWGRHWLDLVRYADSGGGGLDYAMPHMWRYRDYVIRAFNQDRPYDRFIREQLAGDASSYAKYGAEGKIGLGFLRAGVFIEGSGEELRRDLLIDIVNTTGSVFLGVSLGCARCHDHKYDPIPTRDYYGIEAFFAPVSIEAIALPFTSDENPKELEQRDKTWRETIDLREKEEKRIKEEYRKRVVEARILQSPQDLKDLAVPVSDAELGREVGRGILFSKQERDLYRLMGRQTARFANPNHADLYKPMAFSASESLGATNPIAPTTFVLKGGNMNALGEAVQPSFLSAAAGDKSQPDLRGFPETRRKLLAEWIASPGNPLTARVMVNRIWQHHFGEGLVPTPSDFGINGGKTLHPELIDWLATQFIESGWSMKAMHRLMVRSTLYRMGRQNPRAAEFEKLDPERRLLWQLPAVRLESEALRDSILAVSGSLNPARGGPPFFPQVDDELMKRASTWWEPSPKAEQNRRSVYMLQQRSLVFPMMTAFDGVNLNESCSTRSVTTVAPQALSLMNGKFVHDQSEAMAERIRREAGSHPVEQVERAFRLALQRPPAENEKSRALAFLGKGSSLANLSLVLFNLNEFAYVE